MSEKLPAMRLSLSSGEFDATPENTSLFTFIGRLAIYNHIFMQTGEESDKIMIGSYVFSVNECYDEMEDFMVENDYPMHLNSRDVAECDVKAYDRMIGQQLDDTDFIPEDWK